MAQTAASPAFDSKTFETKSILVVEDEGLIAMDLKRRLENFGYSVPAVAATADDAVRLASSKVPALVLMDIRLRGQKDGIDAAADVRLLDIPVIFLTAHADDDTLGRACRTGPYGYIVKPFGAKDIKAQIEVAISRHHTDRNLRRSDAWLAAAMSSVSDAVIATDLEGNIELMNAEAERLTGSLFADVKGMPAGALLRPGPAGRLRCETLASLNRTSSSVIGKVTAFRGVEKRAAGAPRNHETAGVMAASLAHHFRHLRALLLQQSAMLLTEPGKACREADEILQAAVLAAGLGRQIFTSGRNERAMDGVFDLNRAIRSGARLLRELTPRPPSAPASRRLDLKLSGAPLYVRANPTDIQRILICLAGNGREALSRGGRITITTSQTDSGYVDLIFEDTGSGTAQRAEESIFESLRSGIGSGGGMVQVENNPERGTRIRIRFPLAAGPVGGADQASNRADPQ